MEICLMEIFWIEIYRMNGYRMDGDMLRVNVSCIQVAAAAHKGSVAALVLLTVSVVITVVAG